MFDKSIETFVEPVSGYLLIDLADVKVVDFDQKNGDLALSIVFRIPYKPYEKQLLADLTKTLISRHVELNNIKFTVTYNLVSSITQGPKPLEHVKNIIAVFSGKGGVGKSTTAMILALSLKMLGARVGLLDADIYGPSLPTMSGISEKPDSLDGKHIIPHERFGLELMSIGFLVKSEDAVIWRGPMATGALEQILRETLWSFHQGEEKLDYLILDMPPGTGDIPLTVAKSFPISGAVVVTTPQDLALVDVSRAVKMLQKLKIHSAGVLENMSIHTCNACGHQEAIFGDGAAEQLQTAFKLQTLAKLPLDQQIRQQIDAGVPEALFEHDEHMRSLFLSMAARVAANIAQLPESHAQKFPEIRVE